MAIEGQPNRSTLDLTSTSISEAVEELTVSIIHRTAQTLIKGIARGENTPIAFMWSENVDGFAAGDIRFEWYDTTDLEGSLTGFMGADGTSIRNAVLNFPANSYGEWHHY